MTVSDFIKRHGAEAGPEGIALFAYLKDHPSATCTEAAKAIGMGKAALVRHALRLEGLGLIRRTVDKTDTGLILPATLSIADPIQNGKGASDKTPFEMDGLPKSAPLSNQHPYQNGDVDSKEVSLSDPIQNGKGSTGTEVAPLSAETTKRNTPPSPTAQEGADADAPRRPRKEKKPPAESPISKCTEAQRAVLEEWRGLTKAYPPEYAWPTIFERILDGFDAARFKRCAGAYLTHIGRGQRYVGGVLDWYQRNQTEPEERNGNGKVATGQFGRPEVTRDYSKFPRRAG